MRDICLFIKPSLHWHDRCGAGFLAKMIYTFIREYHYTLSTTYVPLVDILLFSP